MKAYKAHPFTGIFGASGGASGLFKSISSKVDLPNAEFTPAPIEEKSVEQKLADSLASSVIEG